MIDMLECHLGIIVNNTKSCMTIDTCTDHVDSLNIRCNTLQFITMFYWVNDGATVN